MECFFFIVAVVALLMHVFNTADLDMENTEKNDKQTLPGNIPIHVRKKYRKRSHHHGEYAYISVVSSGSSRNI